MTGFDETYLGTQATCQALLQRILQSPDALWLDDSRGLGTSWLMAGARHQVSSSTTLASELAALELAPHELMAGFLGYPAPPDPSHGPDLPDHGIGIYSWHLRIHQDDVYFVGDAASASWQALQSPRDLPLQPFKLLSAFSSSWNINDYARAFTRIQSYLQAGDCYQINLCQHYAATYSGDPLLAYLHLREVSPVPYGAFMRVGTSCLLSLSPERFLSIQGRSMLSSPIKGTTPVFADPGANATSRQSLADSAKNRAENLMIVDLLRHDLGRYAHVGSVKVDPLFAIQSFAQVHHMVSDIHAELSPAYSYLDALLGCFPGGSITGAPKHRAMQIIAALEPIPRSAYCGSIFCLGKDFLESSIAIRTLVADAQGTLHAWAGGGITADSTLDDEYEECNHKIGALLRALEQSFSSSSEPL